MRSPSLYAPVLYNGAHDSDPCSCKLKSSDLPPGWPQSHQPVLIAFASPAVAATCIRACKRLCCTGSNTSLASHLLGVFFCTVHACMITLDF